PLLSARISAERLRDELNRLLNGDAPYDIIGALDGYELLPYVLPEVAAMAGVAQSSPHREDVLTHTSSVVRQLVSVEGIAAGRKS
ncbi:hypothetical protein ACYT69_11340, partial [Streptococcus pyogenes]